MSDPSRNEVIEKYKRGEISLGRVAGLLDVSRWDVMDILRENNVELRLGPEDMDDAQREIEAARELDFND